MNVIEKIIPWIKGKRVLLLGFGREGQSTYHVIKQAGGYASLDIADLASPAQRPDEEARWITGPGYQSCMDDYDVITNTDEYLGFIYGMLSADHDIKAIFIDGILKHADITLENIPSFIETLKKISKENDVDFYVSISATNEQLGNVDFEDCTLLN